MNDDEPSPGREPTRSRPDGEPERDAPQRPWPKRPLTRTSDWSAAREPGRGRAPGGGQPRHRHEPVERREHHVSDERHPDAEAQAYPTRARATARVPMSPRHDSVPPADLPGVPPVAKGRARVRGFSPWPRRPGGDGVAPADEPP